ncbi:ferritin-like domain-containing protein [Paenibacillus doosanensis]|uniref:ferritin-like domain-containing protein n=1 Tax=Paenibacillus doosanensis TaxID=1229154 RepID=UPI00218088D6|nr:ferritin-like domain-containing protein [Paenibacillus doosanensis]MCS7458816.1 ferritin-like domain-containing protein [Paenibacillus doosanensis]
MMIKSPSADDSFSLSAKLQYRDVRRFMSQLQWSVNRTATLIRAYASLVKMSPDEETALDLERMLAEEKKYFALLEALYIELKGTEPLVQPEPFVHNTYPDGLRQMIRWERETIRQYRDTYLLTPSPKVRDLFFYGINDSADHLVGLILLQQL